MFTDFFDLIFPDCCISCNNALLKGEKSICVVCMAALPRTHFHSHEDNFLVQKFWGRVPLKYGLAYLHFSKGGKVQNIIHHIKYKGANKAATILGNWYGHDLYKANYGDKFDLIVPVPLHKSKLIKRGYNQSACFAQGLSEGLSIDYSEGVLARIKEQDSQTKKGKHDRWSNVKEIYQLKETADIQNKRILLADDVATTGATIEVCAQLLLNAGAKEISVAVLALAN